MKIGGAVVITPYGDTKYVGILTEITENLVYCNTWYSLSGLSCIRNMSFYKNKSERVNTGLFVKAREKWENQPEAIIEE